MEPKELISTLKTQHRTLQSDLSSALTAANFGVKNNDKEIVLELTKFKDDLAGHLKIENEIFYPDYLAKKEKRGEEIETTKRFIREMDDLAKVVMAFLGKYSNPEAVDELAVSFNEDLMKIIMALNIRIESEEDGVFDIYSVM